MVKDYFIYIIMNKRNTVLYIGVTSDLCGRIYDHKVKRYGKKSFSGRYNINKLVYYEDYSDPYTAICREKQLKGWTRKKKLQLIGQLNPLLCDLYDGLF